MLFVATKNPRELQDELETAKERIEELEGEVEDFEREKTEKDAGPATRIARAMQRIDRIHRDGSNELALMLAHNELETAMEGY